MRDGSKAGPEDGPEFGLAWIGGQIEERIGERVGGLAWLCSATMLKGRFQLAAPVSLTPSAMVALGTFAPPFELPDTDGHTVRLSDFEGKPLLVIFLCNHCPYVKHIAKDLSEATAKYLQKGVAVVGISANDATAYPEDGPAAMRSERRDRGYQFRYLFDDSQEVARAYGATCTPDFFLFDRERRLVYRGQFDGSRPGNGLPVTGIDLTLAVEALLKGEPPVAVQRPSMGCNIKWK